MSRVLNVLVICWTVSFAAPALVSAQDTGISLADPHVLAAAFAPVVAAQGPEVHPTPTRTGLSALFHTTLDDFKSLPRRTSTWVILGVGAAAALATHPADDNLNAKLAGNKAVGRFFAPGKWVGSAPAEVAASAGLYLVGRYMVPKVEGAPKTNKVSHLGFDLVRAQIVSQAIIHGMKFAVRRDRPTGECCSFPSGHAASAFATASVLERHLGYRAAWPTIAIASYVGMSRLHDNRHFVSDVAMGAAIGVATGWTVVGRHGRSDYALVPVPLPGGFAFTVMRREPASLRVELPQ
jgi:membrane-associated phospholipid phosphatase